MTFFVSRLPNRDAQGHKRNQFTFAVLLRGLIPHPQQKRFLIHKFSLNHGFAF